MPRAVYKNVHSSTFQIITIVFRKTEMPIDRRVNKSWNIHMMLYSGEETTETKVATCKEEINVRITILPKIDLVSFFLKAETIKMRMLGEIHTDSVKLYKRKQR